MTITNTPVLRDQPWAGVAPAERHKSTLEETYLLAKFPEYASYQAHTGRFFPKVED